MPVMTRFFLLLPLLAVLCLASAAPAAEFDPAEDVRIELLASADGVPAGKTVDLAVVFRVPDQYHITARDLGFFFVRFDTVAGLSFGPPEFPVGREWQGEEVYGPTAVVKATATALSQAQPGSRTITARVGYQICSETGNFQCFMPLERDVSLDLPVLPAGAKPVVRNASVFGTTADEGQSTPPSATPQQTAPAPPPPAAETAPPPEPASPAVETPVQPGAASSGGLAGSVERALARGSFLALFLVFLGGILTSFTPCVYPIIPITISYIGARSGGSKLGGFFLSLFFVLGMAVMYSSLGVIAALTGGVFGGLTQNPVVYGVIIMIFLAMGASMMGAFDLQLPASWQGKLQSGQRRGALGAVFMGAASGLIAAPCVGPVLVALLTWVAQTGSVVVGFGLLFSFSLGLGLLFVVIGTFAGALSALPQAGGWMETVKHIFGWLLWGTAVYFAQFVLPDSWMPFVWGAFLLLLGIYVGAFRPFLEGEWRWMLGKWVGIVAVVAGVFFLLVGLSRITGWPGMAAAPGVTEQTAQREPAWMINQEAEAFARAAAEGRPLMMDFYADWCVACVELDHRTYNQPEVLARADQFVALKMDFTRQNDWSKAMSEKYGVKGMPTVIFFSPEGQEVERFVGFRSADDVAEIMDRVLGTVAAVAVK
ncbi:MAG: DUF255 domain-containing protein [Candidatus Zixiibacteriota bacterium]|nr:MAG: DUF255 domain-containing protein [candidate division Zixibacteria bacterium]